MGILSAITNPIVYTDANIFIYAFEGVPAVAAELQIFFEALAVGKIKAVTSELSLAEVLVKPIADGRHDIRVLYERAVRDSAGLAVVPITRKILVRAAEVRAQLKLRLPDAIHVATAEIHNCGTFLTNDHELQKLPGFQVLMLSQFRGLPPKTAKGEK